MVELNGRDRAKTILDEGTFRELIDPFEEFQSPHLKKQGIVPQSDDGVIIGKGQIKRQKVFVISIEGEFQGGGIGEVSGAKIAGALELALKDCENGEKIIPILLFDTGGIRLQEANYGLLAIAEIHSAIVALRKYVPVIAVIPGKVGAFGGMAITVGLCSSIIMTREARLGLNGPEVVEQEAGIREFDSKDRILIWRTIGGEQRVKSRLADILVDDDVSEIRDSIIEEISKKSDCPPRSELIEKYANIFHAINPNKRIKPEEARLLLTAPFEKKEQSQKKAVFKSKGRGMTWFNLLRGDAAEFGDIPSVRVADTVIRNRNVRFIAVVPDLDNMYPRARNGEVGLREGWAIAKHVREAMEEDEGKQKRTIVPIVDVPSQAYGYNEESLGIYLSCAAAVDAYASARMAGHCVISFIPGKAISGAFLSHGMQSNQLIALNDPEVNVHVMSKKSAALITQRTLEELEEVTKNVPAMAYDINSFYSLGALSSLVDKVNADSPTTLDRDIIYNEIVESINEIQEEGSFGLQNRLMSDVAQTGRRASIQVRRKLKEQWN